MKYKKKSKQNYKNKHINISNDDIIDLILLLKTCPAMFYDFKEYQEFLKSEREKLKLDITLHDNERWIIPSTSTTFQLKIKSP